jgi:hypothetical protein
VPFEVSECLRGELKKGSWLLVRSMLNSNTALTYERRGVGRGEELRSSRITLRGIAVLDMLSEHTLSDTIKTL